MTFLEDSFRLDKEQIKKLLQNRHEGSNHSLGIDGDNPNDIISDLSDDLNNDITLNSINWTVTILKWRFLSPYGYQEKPLITFYSL